MSPTAHDSLSFGRQQFQADQYSQALQCFDQALKLDPNLTDAWNGRGAALKKLGNFPEALAAYDRALQLDPNSYKAWCNKGLLLEDLKDYSNAVTCYETALKLQPNAPNAADIRTRLNALKQQGYQQPENSPATDSNTREKTSNSDTMSAADAWFNQGNRRLMAGDFLGAIAAFDQALAIKPDYHDTLYHKGAALFALGRYEEAIALCDQALKVEPNHETFYIKGEALSKLGQHEEAIAAYDQALEIRSDKHKTLYAKGYVLCHLRRYKEAIAIFNQALMIKPCEWETLYIKGNALFELGQYEEAISEYEKILAIKSDSHEAFYSKGNALYALEQREKAIAAYNQALEIKPDRQDALTNKSNVLSDLGQYKEAIDTCNQALVFKHDNSAALINKGRALLNLKFWEEAIASLDQALTIKPDLWQAWINRGSASGGSAQCKTTVFLSLPLAMQTSHLDKRGYEGQLASYEEGLKYVQQGSESEGWGKLHWATGRVHYSQGQFDFNFRNYLHKAIKSYQTALIALTLIDFPKAYLEVISELLRAYLGLGNTETAKELRLQGLEVFRDLLNAAPSLVQKRQLEVKFSGFSQVAVDSLVQEGEITAGLEAAERYKNRALSWILEEWKEQVWSPDYEQMQSLLDNSTAVVYWHLSPDALTTFVLKPHATAPILISAQPADAEALERKRALLNQSMMG